MMLSVLREIAERLQQLERASTEIRSALALISRTEAILMTRSQQERELIQELNDNTNQVAAKMDLLIAQARDGVTPTDADEFIASLTNIRDHLKALGQSTDAPIPELPQSIA